MKLNHFKASLSYYMQLRGMKQKDLAARLGVERQTVSNYMRGVSEPDFDTLLRIAIALKVDVNTLLGYSFVEV